MPEDEFLTIPELARLLKVGEKTVYTLARNGELPGFRVGGQWRFARAAIDAWASSGESIAERSGESAAIESLTRIVADELHPRRIYLFGSAARGDAGPDSDIDLLVLVEKADVPLYKLSQRAHSAVAEVGVAVDIVVWRQSDFDERLHLKASLPATVMREGRLLYEA